MLAVNEVGGVFSLPVPYACGRMNERLTVNEMKIESIESRINRTSTIHYLSSNKKLTIHNEVLLWQTLNASWPSYIFACVLEYEALL